MSDSLGFTVLDSKAISDEVKGRLGTEEEPFEGEVPLGEIEKDICRQIAEGKASVPRKRFVFRGYAHKKLEDFLKFLAQFGNPEFILALTCKDDIIKQRFMKKNEVDEVNED
jgi:hypothetical protein